MSALQRRVWMTKGLWCAVGASALLSACSAPPPAKKGLSPEQIAMLQSQGFTESDDGSWMLLAPEKLLFDVGTDQMRDEQKSYVRKLGETLQSLGIDGARVEGHTDDTGTPTFNQQLSERRAKNVAALLVEGGMDAQKVSTVGWGDSRPLVLAQGEQKRRENRRVAIIVQSH